MNQRIVIAKAIVAKGCNLNDTDKYGSTPLHVAVIRQCFEIVELLVESGAELNIIDHLGNTPLDKSI
jgi:ankyrin repeat protein